jgi:hypothetical protein
MSELFSSWPWYDQLIAWMATVMFFSCIYAIAKGVERIIVLLEIIANKN